MYGRGSSSGIWEKAVICTKRGGTPNWPLERAHLKDILHLKHKLTWRSVNNNKCILTLKDEFEGIKLSNLKNLQGG